MLKLFHYIDTFTLFTVNDKIFYNILSMETFSTRGLNTSMPVSHCYDISAFLTPSLFLENLEIGISFPILYSSPVPSSIPRSLLPLESLETSKFGPGFSGTTPDNASSNCDQPVIESVVQ